MNARAWAKMNLGENNQDDLAKWEAEYQQVLQSQREAGEELGLQDIEHDFGNDMQRAWETKFSDGLGPDMGVAPQDEVADGMRDSAMPELLPYQFGM
jgi:hypothetical protein